MLSRYPVVLSCFIALLVPAIISCSGLANRGDGGASAARTARQDSATILTRRAAWLKAHSIPIRSIDPADTDYGDLEPLREAIGEARIVALGESDHGDGATLLAKTRLIKFLHERMGFDVLVFESSLFGVDKVWRSIQSGVPAPAAMKDEFQGVQLKETQALLEYIEREARGEHPLEMAGMDIRLSRSFTEDLSEALAGFGISTAAIRPGSVLRAGFDSLLVIQTRYGARYTSTTFLDSLRALRSQVAATVKERPSLDQMFWSRVLTGVSEDVTYWRLQQGPLDAVPDYYWGAVDNEETYRIPAERIRIGWIRDAQMARNLIWLAREKYVGRKIIVWAATNHTFAAMGGVGLGGASTGTIVRDVFGPDYYNIAFTSFEGTFHTPNYARAGVTAPRPLPQSPTPDTFEDLMARTRLPYAFLALRGRPPGGEWLNELTITKAVGNTLERRRWADGVDAFFFIREQHPATARQ